MAAPFQNYSGGTFLSDLVTRPEFTRVIQEQIYERCQWIQSGVMVRNSALDCRSGGVRVTVPFFQPIPEEETTIESNATWGGGNGYLVPNKITADSQIATILHRGGAFAADDLSAMGSGADPMAAISSYLAKTVLKLRTRTLTSQLEGIFATALANNVYTAGVASGALTEANYLSLGSVIAAKNKLGERAEDLTTIAMHSDVYAYLQQVGALTFSTSSMSSGSGIEWGGGGINLRADQVAFYLGMKVVVDDLIAPDTSGDNALYPVYLMGAGSVMEGVQQEFRVESDRNILSKQSVMSWDHHYLMHVMGTSWLGASGATDNPPNSDLVKAANWDMVYQTSKIIPVVKCVVNTPFS